MDNNSQVQRKPCLTLISQRPTRISDVQRTRFSQRVPTPRSFRLSNAPPAPGRGPPRTDTHVRPTTSNGTRSADGHSLPSNSFQRTHETRSESADGHSRRSDKVTKRQELQRKRVWTSDKRGNNPTTRSFCRFVTSALPTQIRQQVPTRVEPNVNIQPPSVAGTSQQVPTRFPSNINFPTPN